MKLTVGSVMVGYLQESAMTTKEKIKEYNDRAYAKNKERQSVQRKKYRSTPRGKAVQLHSGAKHRARSQGREFDLTKDWVTERIEAGVCEITGIPFKWEQGTLHVRNPYAPSIDRIDSSEGYTADNCRLILWGLNIGFSTWGEKEYEIMARAYLNVVS